MTAAGLGRTDRRSVAWGPSVRAAVLGAWVGLAVFAAVTRGVPLQREQVLLWLVGALVVLTVGRPGGGVRRLVRDWLPFAALLVAYDYTRGAADTLGMPVQVASLAGVEDALWPGDLPTVAAQRALDLSGAVRWYEVGFSLVYVSHFVVPYALGAWLWYRDRERWQRYRAAFLLVTAVGLLVYVLVPAAPPWYASEAGVVDTVHRTAARGWNVLGLDIAEQLVVEGRALANPVAALPSLHAAFSFLVAATCWPACGRVGRVLAAAYAAAMAVTLVVTGEHYTVDVALGWLLVVVVLQVVARGGWWPRRPVGAGRVS